MFRFASLHQSSTLFIANVKLVALGWKFADNNYYRGAGKITDPKRAKDVSAEVSNVIFIFTYTSIYKTFIRCLGNLWVLSKAFSEVCGGNWRQNAPFCILDCDVQQLPLPIPICIAKYKHMHTRDTPIHTHPPTHPHTHTHTHTHPPKCCVCSKTRKSLAVANQ